MPSEQHMGPALLRLPSYPMRMRRAQKLSAMSPLYGHVNMKPWPPICPSELEHMAQMPVLRDEVGARALCVRSVSREKVWVSAGVQGTLVSGCGREAD